MLYALSALHVMLELPLNHQSFAGLVREAARVFAPAPLAAGAAIPPPGVAARRRKRAR